MCRAAWTLRDDAVRGMRRARDGTIATLGRSICRKSNNFDDWEHETIGLLIKLCLLCDGFSK
jgi:hypothetical protein